MKDQELDSNRNQDYQLAQIQNWLQKSKACNIVTQNNKLYTEHN